jgi:drug/metabolite transporter (DMT)-like permease
VGASRLDYALIVIVGIVWGTSFPAIKVAVEGEGVDPFLLTFLRIGIGALSGVAFLVIRGRLDFSVFRNPYVWLLGALNAIAFGLQHLGQVYTTASKTALLVDVNVVFIALLMVAVFRERMAAPKVLAVFLGVAGVAVLTTRLDPSFVTQGELRGDLLVFLAGVVWSVYVVNTKEMLDRGGDYLALSVGVLVTTSVFAAIPLPWAHVSRPISPVGWASIVWLGAAVMFPPIAAWTRSIRVVSPTVAAIILLDEIAVAAALSIGFLGEPFAPFFVLGGVLIVAGMIVASLAERGRATARRNAPGGRA